jgi:hypothetical protein
MWSDGLELADDLRILGRAVTEEVGFEEPEPLVMEGPIGGGEGLRRGRHGMGYRPFGLRIVQPVSRGRTGCTKRRDCTVCCCQDLEEGYQIPAYISVRLILISRWRRLRLRLCGTACWDGSTPAREELYVRV